MAHLEQRLWPGDASGWTRRDRRPCEYAVYLPDPVAGRGFVIDGDVAADVADAEAALVYLDASVSALSSTEALARLLLRAECVASSRIEGLEVGARRLLRADAARALGDPVSDVTAAEVLANIDAMSWGLGTEPGAEITLGLLLETHRRLVAGTRLSEHGGRIRTQQNWIGGSDFNPCSAAFVPPPPEAVPALLDDLVAFCNQDMLPALVQAAIAHAQFETIHPFVDGNGRTGRVLLHLVLRRRRLGLQVVAPVSLVLATRASDYVGGLMGTRYVRFGGHTGGDGRRQPMGRPARVGMPASGRRRRVVRSACWRTPSIVDRARRTNAARLHGATPNPGVAGNARSLYSERSKGHRSVVPGHQPGGEAFDGCRCSPADHSGQTQ